jgi:hypothetical protein
MAPWDEKVPGQGNEAQQLQQAIQALMQNVAKVAQPGGQAPQGGMLAPGNVPPIPGSNISFNPGGAPGSPLTHAPPRPAGGVPPTGSQSIGHFANRGEATNAGLVSLGNSLTGLFGAAEEKEHNKKAAMAENYMTQITSLLASGDPKDREKAQMFMDDPKIRKILKTGLEYVPLEEEKPPEAQGVQTAMQKIVGMGKGGQPPKPQMQAVMPRSSQADQLKSAMTSALLQKIQQDPASAITMIGGSALSSTEERAKQFYESGLGMSPAQYATMTAAERMQGMKLYEGVAREALKAQIDIYKSGQTYKGKIDSAKIFAATRDRMTDAVKAMKDKKGASANFAAGAKVYSGIASDYLNIIKTGKGPDGKPLSDDAKKYYQQKADEYSGKAEDYLNQEGDNELMDMFMKAVESGDPGEEPE